jgi:hypothetical protein
MEKSNKFELKKIIEKSETEYILICLINDSEQKITAKIDSVEPIFGVHFPDDFLLIMRNFPPITLRNIVAEMKKFYVSMNTKKTFSKELQVA